MALKKRTRNILLVILILGIIGGIYGYTEYNRKNADLSGAKADIVVTATQLYSEYTQNETSANAKYFNKVTNVRGVLKSVDKDHTGTVTLTLNSGDPQSNISCQLDARHVSDAENLHAGDTVTVTGTCSGKGESVMGIPSDVLLTRCAIAAK
jgi:Flp pilus assembly protein TadG